MAISSMFSSQASAIAIDFGTASVKMLQTETGARASVIAAAELELPDDLRLDQAARAEFVAEHLPRLLRQAKFRGKRATCSIPAGQTFVQHLQAPSGGGIDQNEYIRTQLHILTGCSPSNLVIRTVNVADMHRESGLVTETICFAVPRDVVMRQIELLKKCRLEVAGVHTEQHAQAWSFRHIHRRQGDENITNMLVDIGWGSTKVAITHGSTLTFSKSIPIGGRHLDQKISESLGCDLASARAHRRAAFESVIPSPQQQRVAANAGATTGSGGSGGTATMEDRRAGGPPASLLSPEGDARDEFKPGGVDVSDLIDFITDELLMCLRYHRSMFESRPVDRVIFLGGESNHLQICRRIAAGLDLTAHVGDPMASADKVGASIAGSVTLGRPLPSWAVAFGLCVGTDH